ncbi:hypothetical protein LQ567_12785 [Niabella pedocola]|uniref:DUF4129 domain-containing protein n=1 Tax=Niabella pedocola TaxID=1752077 RepID=A0ABS8PRC8_9BACT|nr:hypothetical protein [Niabella pedocola]MCD2423644.1 hypothetical protein [Niabella pedocola]
MACLGLLLCSTPCIAQQEADTVVTVLEPPQGSDAHAEAADSEGTASFDPVEGFENEQSVIRPMPGDFTRKLQEDEAFHYVKTGLKPARDQQEATNAPHRRSGTWAVFFEVLPYIAVAVFIILLAWYLASNNFILFRKKSTALETPVIKDAPQDIFSIDYTASIRQALQQKNYRLAIRLQYLELLKKLSDRQLIHFLPDKTNIEYLLQMRSSNYYDDFFTATRHYEYSWYGLFDVTENMYQKINNTFQQLKQKL